MPGRSIVARVVAPSRLWEWKVAAIAMAISALHAVPAYDIDLKGNYSRLKGLHPLTHFGAGDPSSHAAKLDFRLVAPLLLRPFGGSAVAAAVLYALCGVVVYALFARQLRRAGVNDVAIAVGLTAVAVTPAGGVFWLSLRFFDPVAIALAVLALAVRRPWLGVPLAVLALYTDERALIAIALAALAAWWLDKRDPRTTAALVGSSVAVYGVSRVVLDRATDLRTESAETGLGVIAHNVSTWPIGLATAFGFFWILLAVGLFVLLRDREPVGWLLAFALAFAVAAAIAVDDVTRSVAYALPAVPMVIAAVARRWPERATERVLAVALIGSLCVPSYVMAGSIGRANPLPVQVLRWTGVL